MKRQNTRNQPQKAIVLYTVADSKTTLRATTEAFAIGRAYLGFSHDYNGKTQTMQAYPPMAKMLLLIERIGKKEPVGTVLLDEVSYVSPERCQQRKLRTDGKGLCKRITVTVESTAIAWQVTFCPVQYGTKGEKIIDKSAKPIWSKILLTAAESDTMLQSLKVAFLVSGYVDKNNSSKSRADINYES